VNAYTISVDELLLSGNPVALAVETAIAPLRTGELVATCDHLTQDFDAAVQTMAGVCVECPDEGRMCVECSNQHYDTHPPDKCFGCGATGVLRPFDIQWGFQEGRGSVMVVRIGSPWLCAGCFRDLGATNV
jgi:hypothetical protein